MKSRQLLSWGSTIFVYLVIIIVVGSCSSPAALETSPVFAAATETPAPTLSPSLTISNHSSSPTDQRTPADPTDINPLTGLTIANPEILNRRPILVKIENLPRSDRPQWGLSLADLVYEYHTEEGTTRFAAIFYGNEAEMIGPVRSGRLFDIQLVEMYKSLFVFGSAYETVLKKFYESDFADRMIIEGPYTSSALSRYDPEGHNLLVLNTTKLGEVIDFYGIENTPQNLEGMSFDDQTPNGGVTADQVYVRYSGAIYNRWDYDPNTGSYLRFSDAEDDINHTGEIYSQLFDRLTGEPITADNLVMILVENIEVQENIYDILLQDKGEAYLARDGQMYHVNWERAGTENVLTLVDDEGNPFPFKPGQTWFEVLSKPADVDQSGNTWHFTFHMP
jgi:hypothetical protein